MHGDEVVVHKRSDTERTLEARSHVENGESYTRVTQTRDICYWCFGRWVRADENKFLVELDAEGYPAKIQKAWQRMADRSKTAPGPNTAAKNLSRLQARADELQDTQPELARRLCHSH